MMLEQHARDVTEEAVCPFFQPARSHRSRLVPGYCTGVPEGLLMIPTLEEHRTLCSTAKHSSCPIYRERRREDAAARSR